MQIICHKLKCQRKVQRESRRGHRSKLSRCTVRMGYISEASTKETSQHDGTCLWFFLFFSSRALCLQLMDDKSLNKAWSTTINVIIRWHWAYFNGHLKKSIRSERDRVVERESGIERERDRVVCDSLQQTQ